MSEMIILVDEQDNRVGVGEKLAVHQEGLLHRAFSIFVFNSSGELMLQKRASGKYHSGGVWTNTCCSHQRQDERLSEAIHRRLKEEMGFDCPLEEKFTFSYRTAFSNGLIEHELDHVFFGTFDGSPFPNPGEAEDWRWVDPILLAKEIEDDPESYSYWMRACLPRVLRSLGL